MLRQIVVENHRGKCPESLCPRDIKKTSPKYSVKLFRFYHQRVYRLV